MEYIYKISFYESNRHKISHTDMYYLNAEDTRWVFNSGEISKVFYICVDKKSNEYLNAVNNSKAIKNENENESGEDINQLKEKIQELKNFISENFGYEILQYFNDCHSIRLTANRYGYTIEELYENIIDWDGCPDGLMEADDYKECRIEIYGRKDDYDYYNDEDLPKYLRTPTKVEMDVIIILYNAEDDPDLYEIADEYDLWINNLLRLLKENGLIIQETDAKGYRKLYEIYEGTAGEKWSNNKSLNLIEEFYEKVNS
jgi:hypothetical protein